MYTFYRIYLKSEVFSCEWISKRVHLAFSIIRFLVENLKLLVHKLFKGIFKWISFLGFNRFFIRFHGVYRNGSNLKIQSTLKCKHVDGDLLKNSLILICRYAPGNRSFFSEIWLTDWDKNSKVSNNLEYIFDLRLVLKIADRTKCCIYYSFDILTVCFGIPRT